MTSSLPGRVYHLTENYSPVANTGPTEVIRQLSQYLVGQGWAATVLTAGAAAALAPDGVDLVEFPLGHGSRIWRYPRGLGAYLDRLTRDQGAILHLHGVWGAPQWLGARIAARRGVPALLSVHDMLSPWHWQDGHLRRVKKFIYWQTLAYPAFRHLRLVHAITPIERDNLAPQFPGQRLEVIPNSIDLMQADTLLATGGSAQPPLDHPYLLFLGRLHPKKGVDLLIAAFARVSQGRACRLLIVGPDSSANYTAKLKAQVRALGLEERISFLGPVFGNEKWRLFRHAWAFCAPSYSEVVGLVNLEAAAARVPVVTTHETGLYDWEEGGGILVNPRVEEVTRALDQVFSWTEEERRQRGRRLRELVEQRYSWNVVGPRWLQLYSELGDS